MGSDLGELFDQTPPSTGPPARRRGAHVHVRQKDMGYRADGTRSPLIRSRWDDVRWLARSRILRLLIVLALALAAWLYLYPSAQAWWQDNIAATHEGAAPVVVTVTGPSITGDVPGPKPTRSSPAQQHPRTEPELHEGGARGLPF